jgi:hypothetical protein
VHRPNRLNKRQVFEAFIDEHRRLLQVSLDVVKRFAKVGTFEQAVEAERKTADRIAALLESFERILNSLKPSTKPEPGALVVVSSSHFGTQHHLIVPATECALFEHTGVKIRPVLPDFFRAKKIGDVESYWTGRSGEQFEVKDEIVDIY